MEWREGDGNISERLDRYLGNTLLRCLFPQVVILHGTVAYSDHLLVMFESLCSRDRPHMKKQFHFEAMWVGEERCEQIIDQVWSNIGTSFGMEEVLNLIKGCGEELTSWNIVSFGQVRRKLNEARNELEKMQFINSCNLDLGAPSLAKNEVQLWLKREEVMWHQRSRVQWLKEGDQNTRYFHSKASFRKRRNVRSLKDDGGTWHDDGQQDKLVVDFFKNLFPTLAPGEHEVVLSLVDRRINVEMNAELTKPFVVAEVTTSLNQMHPTKAPRPGGMSALFFQSYWHIVGDSIINDVLDSLNTGLIALLREANVKRNLIGVKVCRRAPMVSHRLFVNDSILLCRADVATTSFI